MEMINRRTFTGALATGMVMNSAAKAAQGIEEEKMVWGMQEPGGLGDYFPDGDYVGLRKQLGEYYRNEMSDSEKAEMGMEEELDFVAFSDRLTQNKGAIKPQEWPKEFKTEKTYNSLGSLIKLNNRFLAVDEELKNIIEALEPDVHQFSPIKITMPKGKEYPKQYFGFVIRQFHDSFSPEDSSEGSWNDESFDAYWGERITRYSVNFPQKKFFEGLAMRTEVFGSSHIWREKKLREPEVLFSDALHLEIVNAGLRIPKTFRLKGV